jgi:hypothetical protein
MSCKWNGSDQPRVLANRHEHGCPEDDCAGCLPCPWAHCRVCGKEHAENTCPACLADVRSDIGEILRMTRALPAEVEHRGIESEAMNLLGPVADPEAIGHMRASVRVGRIPADWLEIADNDLHPLLVLGTWMEAYIEAFEHSEPARITIESAASYLDRNLSYASTFADVPFEDFGRNVRECRAYVERVLHDGEQVETGAPCMTCKKPLLRIYAGAELPWKHRDQSRPLAGEDCWACAACRDWRTVSEYGLNVAQAHRDRADWLTAAEVEELTSVTPAALRKRVERGDVRSRRDSGRVVYCADQIPEVVAQRLAKAG